MVQESDNTGNESPIEQARDASKLVEPKKHAGFVRRHIHELALATSATLGALGILAKPGDGKNGVFSKIDNVMLQLPSNNPVSTAVRDAYIGSKSLFGVLPGPTPQQVAAQKKCKPKLRRV